MRVQWELLLGLVILNLSVGLVIALSLPGTAYASPTSTMNSTDYESHFNATQVAGSWSGTPFSGIPIIGDIFAGFNFLWQNIKYLIDGFPTFMTWIKDSYITDSAGQLAFDVIANTLRAIYALLMTVFVIEYISGRYMSD